MVETAKKRMILGAILFTAIFITLINIPLNFGLSDQDKLTTIGLIILTSWFIYLKYAIPRCTKCGYSVISALEIKGFPVFTKMPSGNKCIWCGEKIDKI